METSVYHVCTHGLANGLWFIDEEDYVVGMNGVPVCAKLADVTVFCFCLMSNHVHFVLKGCRDGCVSFIREYKRQRSRQLNAKYKGERRIDGADIFMRVVSGRDDFERLVAYVLRNPMAAGLPLVPGGYRWSSGSAYFSERPLAGGLVRKMGALSDNEKRRMFRSKVILPDEYLVDEKGMVLPVSYVDYATVENIYVSPKHFLYVVSSTNDMDEEIKDGILSRTRYSDSELSASLDVLCAEKYRGGPYSSLRIEERYKLAKQMRKRYGAGPKQLARIMMLDYELLKEML